MMIDCHTHCFPPELSGDPQKWAKEKAEPHWSELVAPGNKKSIQDWASPEKMLQAMDEASVERAVLLGWYWENESTCRWHNEIISEWCEQAPDRFIGFASILPSKTTLAQLERAKALGLSGVGELHPGVQQFNNQSPHWHTLANWCSQNRWILNFHCTRPAGDHPRAIPTPFEDYKGMVKQYPELTFIFAHWGAGLDLNFEKVQPKNVFYDCSASPLLYDIKIFRQLIETVGIEKILFGSDYPLRLYPSRQKEADMESFIEDIRINGKLSPEETEALFADNFKKIIKANC